MATNKGSSPTAFIPSINCIANIIEIEKAAAKQNTIKILLVLILIKPLDDLYDVIRMYKVKIRQETTRA
jgi:hypothetical protein